MKRTAVYCRISEDPKTRVGRAGRAVNVGTQEKDCRKLATELGGDVVEVFVDNDITAAKASVKRSAFERLLLAVESGEVDLLIAHDQSRLSRNNTDLARVLDACEAAGTELHTVKGGHIPLSADGRFSPELINLVNVHEIRRVRERVRSRMQENAERGLPPGGPAGYGYMPDKVTINEDEGVVIKQLAARIIAGDALVAMARDLNHAGTLLRGRPWRPQAIRRIMLSPRIAGLRQHQGQVIGAAAWPAIIDRATFDRVGKVLSRPSRRTQTTTTQKLLTGLATCGKCGETLNHKWDQKGPRYFCRHCHGTLVASNHLDEFILDALTIALDGKAVAKAMRAQRKNDGTAAAVKLIGSLERDLKDLADELGAGRMTMDEWRLARAGIEKRLTQARSDAAKSEADPVLAEWAGQGADLRQRWDSLSDSQRRAIISAIFEAIVVGPAVRGCNRFTPERVKLAWRF